MVKRADIDPSYGGLRLCRISNTMIVLSIQVEHSIRVKAASTRLVQKKAEYNDI